MVGQRPRDDRRSVTPIGPPPEVEEVTDGEDEQAETGSRRASGEETEDAPLSDLAASVDERRDREGPDLFEVAFSEQGFEALEGPVWEAAEEGDGSEFGAIGEVIEEGEETYVVSKQNFCERCRHLSDPPDVRCTHEGTEIREFVDKDHVRVYSCPIVEERGLADGPPAR